ncbi:unnamed protein product [Dicrocoelium dendriticum]|nr:unnamed protein product [Dicrocoelium dendriticum]
MVRKSDRAQAEYKEVGDSIQEVNSSADEKEELSAFFGTNDATDEKHSRSPIHAENGRSPELGQKRSRKIVQRLSETWNKAHVAQVEQRAEAVKQINASLEAGRGVELGSIPLIEASLRKTKPFNLKPLHFMIYGRYGAASEVRSNIRKFRGFAFRSGSSEYTKKLSSIQQCVIVEIVCPLTFLM